MKRKKMPAAGCLLIVALFMASSGISQALAQTASVKPYTVSPTLHEVINLRAFNKAIPPTQSLGSSKSNGPAVAMASREALTGAVVAARREADVVVVSLHWGVEYASRPTDEQKELARAAVEAGADVVLGHHTHSLEGMQLLSLPSERGTRHALIAYSLGNFAFDSPSALGSKVRESVVLRCRLSRAGLVSAEVIPVVLENYLPRTANPQESQSILARLSTLCAELNTQMTDGRINLSN